MKISYFIIFGIVTITNGKPAVDAPKTYLAKNEAEFEKILHTLAKEGKYSPNKQEYKASKSQSRYNPNNRANYGQYSSSRENVAGNTRDELRLINQILGKNLESHPKFQNAQNLLEDLLQYRENDDNQNADDNDNADVADLLNDIQRNLVDDGSYVSQLRCAGNRCADKRGSADDRDNDRDDRARSKDDNAMDFADDRNNDNLVCIGDKCTRTERDSNYNPDNEDSLRCNGKNCARSRYDDKEGNLRFDSEQSAKKVKISDNLDAVMLSIDDVDRLLTNINAPKPHRTHKVKSRSKLVQNIDLDRLLNSQNIANKKANVEAVVFDLTNIENGDTVAKQIKQVLSHDDKASVDDYDDYGNLVEDHLKRGVYNLDRSVRTPKGNSKILPHTEENNNVYVPQWLLNEVMSKMYVGGPTADQLKYKFPRTKQQKQRDLQRKNKLSSAKVHRKVFRRSFDQDVGVPFHLEVQGLGQVSP